MVRNSANTNLHCRAEKVQMSATTHRVAPISTCPATAAGIKDEGHATTQKDGRILYWHGVEHRFNWNNATAPTGKGQRHD